MTLRIRNASNDTKVVLALCALNALFFLQMTFKGSVKGHFWHAVGCPFKNRKLYFCRRILVKHTVSLLLAPNERNPIQPIFPGFL